MMTAGNIFIARRILMAALISLWSLPALAGGRPAGHCF
jgi:hypothetical protein